MKFSFSLLITAALLFPMFTLAATNINFITSGTKLDLNGGTTNTSNTQTPSSPNINFITPGTKLDLSGGNTSTGKTQSNTQTPSSPNINFITPGTKLDLSGGNTNTSNTQTPTTNTGLCNSGQSGLCNPLKAKSITAFLNDILGYLIKVGTVFIILMIVFVGFKFAAARGNAGELEKVRTMFLWTIVGAIIILGAYVISDMITSTISAISQTP